MASSLSLSGMGEKSRQFAIAYGLYLVTLTVLWWRVSVHDPVHGVLGRPYTAVFFISTLLFLASAFVSEEIRFYLWGGSVFFAIRAWTQAYVELQAEEMVH